MGAISLIINSKIYTQESFSFGSLPAVNVNLGIKNGWNVNFKWESRQLWAVDKFASDSYDNLPIYVLSDVSTVLSKKIDLNKTLAFGYLLRFPQGKTIQRSIQQFTIVNRLPALRLAHRFVFDQTFQPEKSLALRLRYRATFEIPLNGANIDPGEYYLKINNEYLNELEAGEYGAEIRLVPLLGFPFSDTNKLEGGIDYRFDSFLQKNSRHRFWLVINWYLKL